MALRTSTLRLASLALLAAGAVAWVAPSAAFNSAQLGNRAASADVKGDTSAYNAPYFPSCSPSKVVGGTCTWYVYDNGTATQTYSVAKQSESVAVVSTWTVDGNSPSGGVATGNAKSVGQSSTVVVTFLPCLVCGSVTVDWILQGANAGVLAWREDHVSMAVTYV